jgi:hypothetical protein
MKDMSTRLVYIHRLQMEASKAENNKAAIPQRIPIRLWIVPSFEKTARPHGHKTDIEVSKCFSSHNHAADEYGIERTLSEQDTLSQRALIQAVAREGNMELRDCGIRMKSATKREKSPQFHRK